ncbi:prefoldin subunit alpha [Nanoarchaeota archaeon]
MNNDIQTKQIELQIIGSQMAQMQKQLQQIDGNLMEVEFIKNSLDELKKSKKESELLAPIAGGIFVKTTLKENDELAVNVGGGVVVNKSVEQTKKLLQDQLGEISKTRKDLLTNLETMGKKAASLEKDLVKSANK